ncbi:MAG: NAD(P)H-hydrate epimerase [Planctomycetota bacterium]|nr:NAD(P)H-hydrate epimerase [Planctomycetota bacterium]
MTALTRQLARAYDSWCMGPGAIESLTLMETAAEGVATMARSMVRATLPHRSIDIVVGRGNNGGDGYAVARLLHEDGYAVRLIRAGPPQPHSSASTNAARAIDLHIPLVNIAAQTNTDFDGSDPPALIIDAILGTGFSIERGPPHPLDAALIRWIRDWDVLGVPILSIDLPSGMDCDLGPPTNPSLCVKATRTVTMVAPKVGFLASHAADFTGPITVVSIGGPPIERWISERVGPITDRP